MTAARPDVPTVPTWPAPVGAVESRRIAGGSDRSERSDPECRGQTGNDEPGSVQARLRRLPPVSKPDSAAAAPAAGRDTATTAAVLMGFAYEAAAALADPNPDLAHERAETAAALAAEARGDFGWLPMPELEHRAALTGFLAAGLQRPPAWSDLSVRPTPGAWCIRCRGRRWWREARGPTSRRRTPTGWRGATCHPPLGGIVTEEVPT